MQLYESIAQLVRYANLYSKYLVIQSEIYNLQLLLLFCMYTTPYFIIHLIILYLTNEPVFRFPYIMRSVICYLIVTHVIILF